MRKVIYVMGLFACIFQPTIASDAAQALVPAEHNPLYLLFLVPRWQSVIDASQNKMNLGFTWYYANIFERRTNQRFSQDFDGELLSGGTHFDWTFTKRFALQVDWGIHRFSGGFLDNAIQDFHHTLGLPNDDRDLVADNRFAMQLIDNRENILFSARPYVWHLGNPQVAARWMFASESAWKLSLGLTGKLPLGSGPFHNSNFDASLGFHGQKNGQRWRFDFQIGALSLSAEPALKMITRKGAGYAMVWLERRWRNKTRTYVQIDTTSPYFYGTGLDTLDLAPVNLVLGMTRPISNSWHLTLSFGEDLLARGPSLDFSLNFGFRFGLSATH